MKYEKEKSILRALLDGKPKTIFEIKQDLVKEDEAYNIQSNCSFMVSAGILKECGRRKCSIETGKNKMQTYGFARPTFTGAEVEQLIDREKANKKRIADLKRKFDELMYITYYSKDLKGKRKDNANQCLILLKEAIEAEINKSSGI